MKHIFISSTLKSEWNQKFNPKLADILEKMGFETYLPQRDTNQSGTRETVFFENIRGIREAKVLIAVCLNESPNLGAEIAFAHSNGIKTVLLTTGEHEIPWMLHGFGHEIVRVKDLEDTRDLADQLNKVFAKYQI